MSVGFFLASMISMFLSEAAGSIPLRVNRLPELRILYKESVENRGRIEPALRLCTEISSQAPRLQGRMQAYRGALFTLKGKHTFWPNQKIKWVNKGLELLDRGASAAPDDLEALFVRATVCQHLPFLFGRRDDAARAYRTIVHLLPSHHAHHDSLFIREMTEYLRDHAALKAGDLAQLNQFIESQISTTGEQL